MNSELLPAWGTTAYGADSRIYSALHDEYGRTCIHYIFLGEHHRLIIFSKYEDVPNTWYSVLERWNSFAEEYVEQKEFEPMVDADVEKIKVVALLHAQAEFTMAWQEKYSEIDRVIERDYDENNGEWSGRFDPLQPQWVGVDVATLGDYGTTISESWKYLFTIQPFVEFNVYNIMVSQDKEDGSWVCHMYLTDKEEKHSILTEWFPLFFESELPHNREEAQAQALDCILSYFASLTNEVMKLVRGTQG